MEVPLSASLQDNVDEPVASFPGATLHVAVDQKSIVDDTGAGSSSDKLLIQEAQDLSRKEVHPQDPDQEEIVLEKEGTGSGLDRDAMKKEAEQSETEHQTLAGSTLVETDDVTRKEKEPELGEAVQKIKDEADIVLKSEKERKGEDASASRESEKGEIKTRTDLNDEENDLAGEGSIQSKVDGTHAEKQKKMENSFENLEKGEEGKNEKFENTVDNISGQPGGEKKQAGGEKKADKRDKKSRSSSERIHKKLEKINAKIGRILAKKEEYEVRLKEAQERERRESEKTAAHEREVSTAAVGKPASDCDGPVTSEKTVEGYGLRLDHDASTKESSNKSPERGLSGSLSRTASLIEVTSGDLMGEVPVEKRVAEKLANVRVSDGSEMNLPLPTKDSDLVMKGQEKVLKHTLHVDDPNDTGTL